MNTSARRSIARVLTVVGAVLLLLGAIFGWADRTVFDADAFGARARSALNDPSVRTVIARTVIRSVVEQAKPDLIAARPLLEAAAETIVATPAFANLFEGAARTTARLLLEESRDNIVVRSNEAVLLLIDTIREYAPEIAKQIPESTETALARVQDVSDELGIWRWAGRVQELGVVLPILALLAWAGALGIAPDRRRGVQWIGGALAVGGFVLLVVLRVGERIVGNAIAEPLASDAGRAVWSTFTEALGTLGWFGIGVGLLVSAAAVAARTEGTRLEPAQVRDRIIGVLRHQPRSTVGQIIRWLLVGALGVALIADPFRVAEITLIALGLLVVYLALVGIFDLVARPVDDADEPTVRRRPVLVVAILLGIVLAIGTVAVLIDDSPEPAAVTIGCNGSLELCDRRLDRVVFPTSHNAMSAADDGYLAANQTRGIEPQLREGIRGLQLDVYLATPDRGRVYTDFTDVNLDSLTASVGPDLAERATRVRDIVGPPPDDSRQQLYLCHVFCELGATRASDAFSTMSRFLARNPNDVLFVILEDYAPVDMLEQALQRAGLADQRYALDPKEGLPTLREMIRARQRLVVVLENQDGGPEMPNGYDDGIVQETPFTFRDANALAAPSSCEPERGLDTAPIFLVNHWVTPASLSGSITVNQFEFLDDRVRRCETERGLLANLVAVDFVDRGDLYAVVDELNEEAGQ